MCCLSNLAGENKKYVFQTGIRYFRQNVKMSKRQYCRVKAIMTFGLWALAIPKG